MNADASLKAGLGISGHANAHLSGNANISANDGTITRFRWKAQNKSLIMFAGEAHNVERGVTNQLFSQERDETPGCLFNATPEDTLNFTTTTTPTSNANAAVLSDIEAFADFNADAGAAHSRARQAVHHEWTGYFRKDRLCPLSHAFFHHRQEDC